MAGLKASFKSLYLKAPDGPVNRRYRNFKKMVWMTMVEYVTKVRQIYGHV